MRFQLLRHSALLIICCLLIFGAAGAANAGVPLMPLEEIQVGAQGTALTVITGTRIEEFGIEVLGIMKNKGAVGDLILVRTYGDVIERAGGVAQGMSGSPVYIDGRLIGAIGYGWSLTDQRIAMVTPIQDMLKLLERAPEQATEKAPEKPPEKAPEKAPQKALDKAPEKAPEKAPRKTSASADKKQPPVKSKPADKLTEQLTTPLMAAGFSENALFFLKTKLKPLQLTPHAVGDAPSGTEYGPLKPGSSIGVQLIRGDVSLGALGTVTYVDGDKVLAFGHPFLKRGSVGFLMTNAYIFTTIRGIENSFKVGSTGEAIGIIGQDRGAGVAGEMSRYPGIVPMRMNVRSADSDQTREMSVQVVQDEEILPILTSASLLSAIDKTVDRKGSGTARISFEVSARDMPGEIYKRENMFFSPENVAEASLAEFYEFIAFLASNPHNPVTIMDIRADVSVSQERRTARIISARPVQPSAKPGEVVEIEVQLKPYRAEPITRNVSFTVPKEQAAGVLNLSVRGGGFFSITALLKKLVAEGETPKPTRKPPKSFEEMMKDFSARDRNNDIVVEVPGASDSLEEGLGGDQKPKYKLPETAKAAADKPPEKPAKSEKSKLTEALSGSRKSDSKIKGFVTTDYIVEGDTDISIEISKAGTL